MILASSRPLVIARSEPRAAAHCGPSSSGRIFELSVAIDWAEVDWRPVVVAAGFDENSEADLLWWPSTG